MQKTGAEEIGNAHVCSPASDLERYAVNSKPTNSQKDAFKISPMQPGLCGLDRLFYNSFKGKPGRSS
jgi:hypothetical protein